jgi:hypothetical protein
MNTMLGILLVLLLCFQHELFDDVIVAGHDAVNIITGRRVGLSAYKLHYGGMKVDGPNSQLVDESEVAGFLGTSDLRGICMSTGRYHRGETVDSPSTNDR